MNPFSYRACTCAILIFLSCTASAADDNADVALTLGDAAQLAVEHQPLLQAQNAAARAAHESAIASRQLPDPRLNFGVRDLPVDTGDRYSLRRDSDTQLMVGVAQEFTRGEKRRLRGERDEREAEFAEQEALAIGLLIRRDAALAWIEVWKAERETGLARASVREAEAQVQAVDIAYRSGRASQPELLAARLDLQRMQDEVADQQQQAAHARSLLSRWIGADADRLLCPDLPDWPAPPALPALLAKLRVHPHLNSKLKQIEVAQADVALAQALYKPDWRAELDYGHRQDYSDMVSLQIGIDLPLFTGQRQDRAVAASLQQQERAENLRDDEWRQEESDARLNYTDWTLLRERLRRYDEEILPQDAQRIESARLAWQAGPGTLAAVLDARRMALTDRMKRIELQADAAKHRTALMYVAGEQP